MNATKPKITESDIQRQIKEFLQWHGWFVVKIHQSLGSYKGIADLYALKDGRHVWIEVKMPKGRLSEYQEKFRNDVIAHGGSYIVARSIEDVEHILKENAKNSNKKDELVKVLKQARDAINGYSTCPYCWGVNGHAKGCKFYEALQNIDALIGGKEDV